MKVEDDYIKDKELQDGLSKSKANGMNWWDGKEEYEPHAHIYDLIKQVWPVHIYEGFEYWINDYPVGDQLDWHNDKDEYAYKHFDTIIMPAEGIVYYTHADDVEGGVLEITNGDKDVKIHPKKNRLVKFKTGMMHRVTEMRKGKRRSILVNAWRKKPNTFNVKDRDVYDEDL
tara:strand:- start:76 stop:591 length:516 start_codon:yes stop_codon:yes gene_type:complete